MSLKELCLACWSTKADPLYTIPSADWWCWVICCLLARTCVNWSCLCSCWGSESSAAACACVGPAESLYFATQSVDLLSASKSTIHTIAAAKSRECSSTEILWMKSCRGWCKALRFFFSRELGWQTGATYLLPPRYRWALCPTRCCNCGLCTCLALQYLSCILRCCAFCGQLLLRFPDVWSSISSPLLSRQHWHRILTAQQGL